MKIKNITKTFIGVIALFAVIGFFMSACDKNPETGKHLSGTVTADTDGTVLFKYSRTRLIND